MYIYNSSTNINKYFKRNEQMIYNKIVVIALLFLVGCAQTTGYRPVVDTYNDPRAAYLNQDAAQCEQIAKDNSGVGRGVATDGLTGALIGGATGAALGAVIGNPATGAAIGGTIGGLGGATKGGVEADQSYKRIFKNCLRGRGHNVLD
jgi:hypothetical protein